MSELVAAWKAKIERDLAPFIDPGTELLVMEAGSIIEVTWEQYRQSRSAKFRISRVGGGIEVEFDGRQYTYPAFFASERMADLTAIAKGTLGKLKSSIFVETKARPDDGDADQSPGAATEVIAARVESSDPDDLLTDLIMITAEAGAGKTSVLKQLVRIQADNYLRGKARHLYLYVDAQGRALARFNEALATELNEIRVMLPFHAVPTLVRLGLIIPVIDGFDELIGAGGYDDAYNSISSFIEDLSGEGVIIASARSTYYEQEFLARANSTSSLGNQSWKLNSIRILGWGDVERRSYIASLGVSDADQLAAELERVFSGDSSGLASKPLFVARAAEVLKSGGDLSGDEALLERLISSFIQREQRDKLRDRNEQPILTVAQLRSLCGDLAEEMWAQSTRELDRLTVKELTEYALSDSSLKESNKHVVIERMPTMAFLMRGESVGSVAFEHELFFSHFLAERIAARITEGGVALPLLLGRSVMPESLAEGITARLGPEIIRDARKIINILCGTCVGYVPRLQQVKENVGKIMNFLLRTGLHEAVSIEFSGFVFPGSSLRGIQFVNCNFEGVEFRRVDLAGAQFIECGGNQIFFDNPLIDKATKLEFVSGVDMSSFLGLRVAQDGGEIVQIFDPSQIQEHLAACDFGPAKQPSATRVRNVDAEVVRLVDRLARAYMKSNPVCVQEDGIFSHPKWPDVERAALASEVVRQESRATSGKPRRFLRRTVSPSELMAGLKEHEVVPPSVREFWENLESSCPAI